MTTTTLPRATVEQALEALRAMNPYPASKEDQRASALAALLAALADPVQEPAFHGFMSDDGTQVDVCFSPSAPRRDGTYATAYYTAPPHRVAQQAEPVEPVDVGLLEYRGNSVAFIHQKMTAYRAGIDAAWDAFRAKGLHPDGKTPLANMIAKYTAPPQRKPLTEKEMYAVEEEARKNFRLSQKGPRGQQITYWDGLTPWLIRAVERAHGIKE